MRLLKNKKAQFGPDVLIGVLLIAVLGLGGVFFLNVFVNSLALNGLLGVIDSEQDQKCFFMVLPLSGDEYLREGITQNSIDFIKQQNNLEGNKLESMKRYFGGFSNYENQSKEFEEVMKVYEETLNNPSIYRPVVNVVSVKGFISTPEQAIVIRSSLLLEPSQYSGCSLPVYNPYGKPGIAELYIRTTE